MNCVFSKNAMRKKRWKCPEKYLGTSSSNKINYREKHIFFIICLLYLKFIKLDQKPTPVALTPSDNFIPRNQLCKRMLAKLIYKIIRSKDYVIY